MSFRSSPMYLSTRITARSSFGATRHTHSMGASSVMLLAAAMAINGTPAFVAMGLMASVVDDVLPPIRATAFSCWSSRLAAVTASLGLLWSSGDDDLQRPAEHAAGCVDGLLEELDGVALRFAQRRGCTRGGDHGAEHYGFAGRNRGSGALWNRRYAPVWPVEPHPAARRAAPASRASRHSTRMCLDMLLCSPYVSETVRAV